MCVWGGGVGFKKVDVSGLGYKNYFVIYDNNLIISAFLNCFFSSFMCVFLYVCLRVSITRQFKSRVLFRFNDLCPRNRIADGTINDDQGSLNAC